MEHRQGGPAPLTVPVVGVVDAASVDVGVLCPDKVHRGVAAAVDVTVLDKDVVALVDLQQVVRGAGNCTPASTRKGEGGAEQTT